MTKWFSAKGVRGGPIRKGGHICPPATYFRISLQLHVGVVFDSFPKEVKRFRRALFLEEFILFEYLMTCSIWLQVAVFEKGHLGRWQPTTQPPMPTRLVPPRQPINGNRKTNKNQQQPKITIRQQQPRPLWLIKRIAIKTVQERRRVYLYHKVYCLNSVRHYI